MYLRNIESEYRGFETELYQDVLDWEKLKGSFYKLRDVFRKTDKNEFVERMEPFEGILIKVTEEHDDLSKGLKLFVVQEFEKLNERTRKQCKVDEYHKKAHECLKSIHMHKMCDFLGKIRKNT